MAGLNRRKEIINDKLLLASNFFLKAMKHKNCIWTLSRVSTRPICVGFQRMEQNTNIGLIKEVIVF